MARNHWWTKDEEEYLTKSYGKMFALEISKRLGLTERSVIAKANRMGLKSNLKSFRNPIFIKQQIESRGFLLLDKYSGIHKHHKLICPECDREFTAPLVHILHRNQTSCGCVSFGRRKGSKNLSMSYFSQIKRGAVSRNICFDLTIDYIDKILVKQEFKCNLSGWPIDAGYLPVKKYTASLDRINSAEGYVKNNVQWVHKSLNLAKQSFSQEFFIEMCKAVTINQRSSAVVPVNLSNSSMAI